MGKKFALIIMVVLALTLSACDMSASTPAPTPKKGKAKASATFDPMEQVKLFSTQTAQALSGTPSDLLPLLDDGTPTATLLPGQEQPTLDPLFPTPTGNPPALATVTAQSAQPTVQTVRPGTYTLQQGEFIYCLARRFDVDVNQTLAINGLHDSETLQPGRVVQIPASGSFTDASGSHSRALRPHPATYTVQSGDSIYSVACLYGDVDPINIAAVNGLAAPYTLTVGAQIQIP